MSTDNQLVHNWLMNIPPSLQQQQQQRQTVSPRRRPLSTSSEDSINLDELINANYTTCMDDETDLTALATIDLDDSNEDFWKLDNVFHHIIPPKTKTYCYEQQDHILNISNLSLYDNDYPKRYDRSGSLSSDSTTSSQPILKSSLLPRSKQPSTSKSETTSSRRATHIPTPKSTHIHPPPSPQRTKSTVLHKKSSTGSLTRSMSRSHIPAPPVRSTTSLSLRRYK